MNLSIAAKFGFSALALAAVLVACPDPVVADTTKPTISSVAPTGTAVDKTVTKISVTFSEEMDPTVLNGVITYTLPATAAPAISAPVWSNGNKTYTVTTGALTAGASYKFKVANTVKDKAGNILAAAAEYPFTVKADVIAGGTLKTALPSKDGNIAADYPTASTATSVLAAWAFSGTSASVPGTFAVGNAFDAVNRGVMRFALPAGVTPASVTSATLKFNVPAANVIGTPLTTLGGLQIKGVNFGTDVGADPADSKADFELGDVGATDVAVAANKVTLDVTAYVKTLVSGGNADFIVRFKTEPANKGAYTANQSLRVASTEAADTASKPVLEITVP